MYKTFSFSKQKKIIYIVLLFSVLTGVIIPRTTHADLLDDIVAWEKKIATGGINYVQNLGKDVIAGAGKFLISLVIALLHFAQSIFNQVVNSESVQKAIIADGTVIKGWTVVRDFANMFIVLGFVVIGLATILRIREYEAQKLLPKLIIIALLINFSLLITGIVIDGANITINYFMRGAVSVSGSSITNPIVNVLDNPEIYKKIDDSLGTDTRPINWVLFGTIIATISLMAAIAAMLFIIYAMLFLFRQVALMALVILSPLAFVCFVFPRTKSIFDKWLSQFIQWCVVGIPAAFFMWLSADLFADLLDPEKSGDLLSFFIPVAFLYFAYTLTFQISAIGAAGAIGAATGAMGFVAGAGARVGRGAAGLAANATGATRVGQYIGDKATRIGEGLGLVARGYTANKQAGRLDDARKRMANQNDNTLSSIINKKAFTQAERLNKAAAIERAYKEGKTHLIKNGVAGKESAVAYASSYGVGHDTFEKDPESVRFNKAKVDEQLRKNGITNPRKATTAQRAQAQRDVEANTYAKAPLDTLADMPKTSFNINMVEVMSGKKLEKLGERLSYEKQQLLKSLLTEIQNRINTAPNSTVATAWQNRYDAIDNMS